MHLLTVLSKIAKVLNQEKVTWAVGASVLLYFHQLVEKPNDIDVFVAIEDIEAADAALSQLGTKKTWEKSDDYASSYFYEYVIDGIDVDVIAGFKIKTPSGLYEYAFSADSIVDYKEVEGEQVPLTSLEDWYVLYQKMTNREAKVALIESALGIHQLNG